MKAIIIAGALALSAVAGAALAQAPAAAAAAKPAYDYVTVRNEIAVNKSAAEAWKKVGGYCDIKDWLGFPGLTCTYTTGSGDVGTNRLIGGRTNEVMVSRTELGYGYAQPLSPDQYHGFVEIVPTGAKTSKILYTLVYDQSIAADQAAKDAKRTRLATMFKSAVEHMKASAEK